MAPSPLAVDAILPPGVRAASAAARRLEELGFDGLFAAETVTDPFVDLVLPARETRRPLLGTNLALAFARSPFVSAVNAWQLQELSGGRFVLGLGTQVKGHVERRLGMPWESPGPKLREHVAAVKALFEAFRTGEAPAFEGRFYRHTLLPPVFRPQPIGFPDPPVWVAAVNEYNLETAGMVADGLLVHPLGSSPKYLAELGLPAVERGLTASGRDRSAVTLQSPVFLAAGDTEEERAAARASVRAQLGWYASTRTYRRVLDLHGYPDLPDRLHALMTRGDLEAVASAVPDGLVEAYVVEGTPEEAAALVVERYRGVVERVFLYNLFELPFSRDEPRLRAFLEVIRS